MMRETDAPYCVGCERLLDANGRLRAALDAHRARNSALEEALRPFATLAFVATGVAGGPLPDRGARWTAVVREEWVERARALLEVPPDGADDASSM